MKNYSLSIKLFISLMLFLVVSLVILNIVSDVSVVKNIEKEISKNCIGKLKVADNVVMQLTNMINRETIRLSIKSEISNLEILQKQKTVSRENIFIISSVLDSIIDLIKTDNVYHSIYLYLDDVDHVITSNKGYISTTNMIDDGWIQYYHDYKEENMALSWTNTRIPSGSKFNYTGTPEYVITYIYPLTPYTTSLRGAVIVNIREKELSRQINGSNFDREGYIMIINNEGDVISHVDDKLLSKNIAETDYAKTILESTSGEGYLVSEVDGSRSIISYLKTDTNDWIYIGIFSLNDLISKSKRIRINSVYISALILLAGVLIALYISKRLSSPLKKLIQDINETKGINLTDNDNEIMILHKAFNTLKKRDENLFNFIENNQRSLKESYLYNLLLGNTSYEIDSNITDINIKNSKFMCAVISLDSYGKFTKDYEMEQQYYIKMLILEVAEEILNQSFTCKGANMDNGEIALIIFHVSEKEKIPLTGYFRHIQQEIAKVIDYTISIGAGSFTEGSKGVKTSYTQALEAVRFKFKYGYESIIFWTAHLVEHKYYYPFAIERYLVNYLDLGDKKAITETIELLAENLKKRNDLSCDNIMQIFNQLINNTIVKYLMDSHINMLHVFGGDFNIYSELALIETLDDITAWLIEIYNTIIDCQEIGSNDNKFDKILEFIHKNYKRDIGVRDVAEYTNLSYSHARKIFKDETGGNIVDYINGLRVNEAKSLLIYEDMNIKEIANCLGYNNDQSFTRAFKKIEGVTPGKYRSKTG